MAHIINLILQRDFNEFLKKVLGNTAIYNILSKTYSK